MWVCGFNGYSWDFHGWLVVGRNLPLWWEFMGNPWETRGDFHGFPIWNSIKSPRKSQSNPYMNHKKTIYKSPVHRLFFPWRSIDSGFSQYFLLNPSKKRQTNAQKNHKCRELSQIPPSLRRASNQRGLWELGLHRRFPEDVMIPVGWPAGDQDSDQFIHYLGVQYNYSTSI